MKQLISLVKLKKYFPLKGGLFQKRRFLHANEEITLNVTEGETLAVVGDKDKPSTPGYYRGCKCGGFIDSTNN